MQLESKNISLVSEFPLNSLFARKDFLADGHEDNRKKIKEGRIKELQHLTRHNLKGGGLMNILKLVRKIVLFLIVMGSWSFGYIQIASAVDPIRIGESVSLQGYMGIYGKQMHQGAMLAVEQVNKEGGIKGRPVEFIWYEEASSRERVLTNMTRLCERDEVIAITGPTGTVMSKVGWPIAARHGVPVITSTTAPKITEIGSCCFRYSLPESEVYPVAVKKIVNKFKPRNAVVVYAKDESYSATNKPFMVSALEHNNVAVLDEISHPMQAVDYSALVTKIKGLNPDLIAMTTLPEPGINTMRAARRMGLTQPFLGGNAFNTPRIIELGEQSAEGLMVGTPWFKGNADPVNRDFVEAYKERFDEEPDQFAAQSYHGMLVVFAGLRSIELTGNLKNDRAALCKAMTKVKDVPGPLGRFNFDSTRSPRAEGVVVIQVKNGEFVLFD